MRMRSALLVLLLPSAAMAQREPLRQPAAVPLDLAIALASSGGLGAGSDPQILVGELPEWMTTNIHIPSSALILGAASMGTTTIGFLQTLPGPEALGELDAGMEKKGWRRSGFSSGAAGGFRMLQTVTQDPAFPTIYCSADRVLYVTAGALKQGKQTWVFRLTTQARNYSPCSAPERDSRSAIPTLYHPLSASRVSPSMRPGPDCSTMDRRSLGGGSGTSDRVATTVSADSLLAHYGRQLVDSGWTAVAGHGMTLTRHWTRTDSTGRRRLLEIQVAGSTDNPSCRELRMMHYGAER